MRLQEGDRADARACSIHCAIAPRVGHRSRRCRVATWSRKICWCILSTGVWASCAEEAIPAWSSSPQYSQPTPGRRDKSANATHLLMCWIWISKWAAKACLCTGLLACWSSCKVVLMPQSINRAWFSALNPGSCSIRQLLGMKRFGREGWTGFILRILKCMDFFKNLQVAAVVSALPHTEKVTSRLGGNIFYSIKWRMIQQLMIYLSNNCLKIQIKNYVKLFTSSERRKNRIHFIH